MQKKAVTNLLGKSRIMFAVPKANFHASRAANVEV